MKKTLLLVLIAGTLFASSNRVNVMGGAGFWGDDYASMTVYPANVNNHNVATPTSFISTRNHYHAPFQRHPCKYKNLTNIFC